MAAGLVIYFLYGIRHSRLRQGEVVNPEAELPATGVASARSRERRRALGGRDDERVALVGIGGDPHLEAAVGLRDS